MISKDDLTALAGVETSSAVSVYLPTHEKGREIAQDPIRLRNALAAVTARLVEAGHRKPAVDELLGPAHGLVQDEVFWRYQALGLAVFVAPGFFQHHRLPIVFPEMQEVGPRFHLRPLMPLLADDGRFYALCVRAGDARLYQGSRFGIVEIEAEGLPRAGVAEVSAETEYERSRDQPSAGSPASHAFGDTPEEERKVQLIEYLRRIDGAVKRRLGADQAPVVLVAQPEVQGHLRALSKEVRLLGEGVPKDPSAMNRDALHAAVYEVVRPLFAEARERAVGEFKGLVGTNDRKGGTDLKEVVSGARFGRVESLFVTEGEAVWGSHDETGDELRLDKESSPENEDLVDFAAVRTMLQGGAVHVLPREQMPFDGVLAAIFRY